MKKAPVVSQNVDHHLEQRKIILSQVIETVCFNNCFNDLSKNIYKGN